MRSPIRLGPLTGPLVLALVGSRLVVLAAAVAAERILARNPALTSGDGSPILRSLTAWDGWWYLGIARSGYHAEPLVDGYVDHAFLPGYPVAVRLLSLPWPEHAGLVAVVLSNLLFVVGLLLLVALGRSVLGDARAERGAVVLALSPFAAVFSMAYAESLFLVLSVGALLALERGRVPLGGLLLALAALTRLQGILLVLPAALILARRHGSVRPAQAWLLLGPLAALGWFAWVGALAGDAGAYAAAQGAWGRVGIGAAAAGGNLAAGLTPYQASLLATLLGAVFLLVYLRPDRIPLAYASIPVLSLGAELASGLLEAVGRIATLAFPNAWLIAGRGPLLRRAWLALSTGLLFVVSAAIFTGGFVP